MSGLWIRRNDSAALVEVLFDFVLDDDLIIIRRVLMKETDRLPDWSRRPDEWGATHPWPVVDL
jgi:hypothetical protein